MDGPEAERLYYRLAPGTDVVRVGDGDMGRVIGKQRAVSLTIQDDTDTALLNSLQMLLFFCFYIYQ